MLTLLFLSVAVLPAPAQAVPAPHVGIPAPAEPVSPYGPDWQWDAARGIWFRYGPAQPVQMAPVQLQMLPLYQPTQLQMQSIYPVLPTQPARPACVTGYCPWRR